MTLGWVNAFLAYLSICYFLTIYNRICNGIFLFVNEVSKNCRQRNRRKENWPFLCETHVGFVKCSGNKYYFGCCFSRFTKTNLCFCYLEMRFSLSLTTMFMLQFVKQTTFSSTCRTLKIIKETSILIKHIKELYDHLLKQYAISKLL